MYVTYTFVFPNSQSADDVFQSIKSLSVVNSVTQLYAFFATPHSLKGKSRAPFNTRDEFTRMGVGTRTKAWRFTDINKDYTVSRILIPFKERAQDFRSSVTRIRRFSVFPLGYQTLHCHM